MQIVYISNRKNLSEETLKYVENLMPFIHEAVYICPGVQMNEFKFNSSLKITVIDESNALGKRNQLFRESKDHQFRNWLLRSSLSHLEFIDDEFIMSDDDSRPLKEIPMEFFKRANKYHAYQFFDLEKWSSFYTDYDLGQHNTFRFLEKEGYPTLSYSAHMPQIINKAILGQVLKRFESVFQRQESLDEWSVYFNYAQKEHPDLFHGPLPFKTFCWPVMPSDWAYHIRPDGFFFENFCPYLYQKGRIFAGIPTGFSPEHHRDITAEKIRRRTALQNAYETGKISTAGKAFIALRDRVVRFPRIKSLLDSLLSPGLQMGMLDFFLRLGSRVNQGKSPKQKQGKEC